MRPGPGQMRKRKVQDPSEIDQMASDAYQPAPKADRADYMVTTKPTRMRPNALQTKKWPPTDEI